MEDSWAPGIVPLTEKEYKKLKEKAAIIDFLFDEEGVRTGNLLGELQIWREKAEKWNALCEGLEYGWYTPVENILQEINLIDRDNKLRRNKLEAIKTWIETCPKRGEGGLEELEKILEDEG